MLQIVKDPLQAKWNGFVDPGGVVDRVQVLDCRQLVDCISKHPYEEQCLDQAVQVARRTFVPEALELWATSRRLLLALIVEGIGNVVSDIHMNTELVRLPVGAHACWVLKLENCIFDKIDAAVFTLKCVGFVQVLCSVFIGIRLEHVQEELDLSVHGAFAALLGTWHGEQANRSRCWFVSWLIMLEVGPNARLKPESPHHSIVCFEDATLNVVPYEVLLRPIVKYLRRDTV